MKNYLLTAALLVCLDQLAYAYSPVVVDSIGVEKKGGKRFILHRVDEGQTLFAIARRYGTSVADLKAANPDVSDAVQYAQVVRVPAAGAPARDAPLDRKAEKAARKQEKAQERETKDEQKAAEKSVAEKPAVARTTPKPTTEPDDRKSDDNDRLGIHVVEPGQTLYSLAVRYGVSQADLRRWNGLPANNVLIGQALIVSEKAYQVRVPDKPLPNPPTSSPAARPSDAPARPTTTRPEPKPEPVHTERTVAKRNETPVSAGTDNRRNDVPRTEAPRPDATRTDPPRTDASRNETPAAGGTPRPTDLPVSIIEPPRAGNDAPLPTVGRRMAQSGVAEMIEGADGSGKYLALHRTAPIGTLVLVRNEFNNQLVWVKVVGRLPDTGVNDKILIKLSQQAFAKLSPEDRRFRAEVSYIVK